VLEELAFMAWHNLQRTPDSGRTATAFPVRRHMQQELLDKHYLRKHGKDAYYGQ